MNTIILNIHKDKALIAMYEKQGLYRYCGRGSVFGNPFSHMEGTKAIYRVATRHDSIVSYRGWAPKQSIIMESLEALRGCALGCYCWPLECHCQVLIEMLGEPSLRKDIYLDSLF
jgi:hypothetical protein